MRAPRAGNVADVLAELSKRLGPDYQGRPLRLLEVFQSKIYKVRVGGVRCESVLGWERVRSESEVDKE